MSEVIDAAVAALNAKLEGEGFDGTAKFVIEGEGAVVVDGTGAHARFMLFGGAPMEGPRYIWWNFVSSRRERIEEAREEWRQGKFSTVPGDEADFIPAPEGKPKIKRAQGGVFYP